MAAFENIHLTSAIALGTLVIAILMSLIVSPTLSSASATMADLNQTQTEEAGGAETELITGAEKEEDPILLVSLLANELKTSINKSGAILEITSRLPKVGSTPFASSISPEFHGIPEDADMPKRKVAQDILAVDKDFQLVYFLMPNGDIYFEEPYSRQENLTINNLAFRDYYKGVLETGDTYLSNVYLSASSVEPQASIAVPIYLQQNNNATLVGIWGGGLNLTMLSKPLKSLNLSDNERIVYVDGQGQKIADSVEDNQLLMCNTNESFADLQSFRNAIINGESGTITELVNGTSMLVSYHPVKSFSNVWAVLYMQQQPPSSNQTVNPEQGMAQ